MIIENYPTNLITKDRWGALPLLYAFWGAAPTEIIHVLLESYQLHYPDHVFNLTMMVRQWGGVIRQKKALITCWTWNKSISLSNQLIGYICSTSLQSPPIVPSLEDCSRNECNFSSHAACQSTWKLLPSKSGVIISRITKMIHTASFAGGQNNSHILCRIRAQIAHFEDELPRLKDATTILEVYSRLHCGRWRSF